MTVIEFFEIDADGRYVCHEHGQDNDAFWCEHLSNALKEGLDSPMYHPGMMVLVPVLPWEDVFAPVSILSEPENWGNSGLMMMNWTPDIGKTLTVNLGFWNPGDGGRAISLVIMDYLRSRLASVESLTKAGPILTKCPSPTHSFLSERLMDERASKDVQWKRKCLWNIVMEKACTVCIDEAGSASPVSF